MSLVVENPFNTTTGLLQSLENGIRIFNKKFRNFCEKSPLRLSYCTLPNFVTVTLHKRDGELQELKYQWEQLEEMLTQKLQDGEENALESAVKDFIYRIRLELAPHLPVLAYRKYRRRDLTPEEMISVLVAKEEDSEVFTSKQELVQEKTFILEQVILPRNLFALTDVDGNRHLFKLKNGMAMPFLYQVWNTDMTPDELGRKFFSRAKLVSRKQEQR